MRGEHIVALLYLKASELDMDSLAEVVGLIADAVARSAHAALPPADCSSVGGEKAHIVVSTRTIVPTEAASAY